MKITSILSSMYRSEIFKFEIHLIIAARTTGLKQVVNCLVFFAEHIDKKVEVWRERGGKDTKTPRLEDGQHIAFIHTYAGDTMLTSSVIKVRYRDWQGKTLLFSHLLNCTLEYTKNKDFISELSHHTRESITNNHNHVYLAFSLCQANMNISSVYKALSLVLSSGMLPWPWFDLDLVRHLSTNGRGQHGAYQLPPWPVACGTRDPAGSGFGPSNARSSTVSRSRWRRRTAQTCHHSVPPGIRHTADHPARTASPPPAHTTQIILRDSLQHHTNISKPTAWQSIL